MAALHKCHMLMIVIDISYHVSNFQEIQAFEVEMPHSSM
jgi:hypothetical protein